MSKRSYRKYIGIPFVDGGRDFSGVDCYGVIVLVYREEGIKLWDTADYNLKEQTHSKENLMLSNYHKDWVKVDDNDLKELDILLFNMDEDFPDIPTHVALYIGEGKLLHCMRGHPIHIVKLKNSPMMRYFQGAYRYKCR